MRTSLSFKSTHLGFWLISLSMLTWVSISSHPLLPVEETRYLSVAWDMWFRHHFLLPSLNGVPYSDKPPLLFWLIHLGWSIFGVNSYWPRVLPALFSLANLCLTLPVARKLYPQEKQLPWQSATVLLGLGLWFAFSMLIMFDLLLSFFVLLGVYGLLLIAKGRRKGILLTGLAIGFGILSKGPVMLLHLAFIVLFYPWWSKHGNMTSLKKWYGYFALSLIFGSLIALSWAIPTALIGGPAYSQKIFLSQTLGRLHHASAHGHPFWWYFPRLLFIAFPWVILPRLWKILFQTRRLPQDSSARLLISWIVPTFLVFCFISGKQTHYLLPLFPGIAIGIVYLLRNASPFSPKSLSIFIIFLLVSGLALLSTALFSNFFPTTLAHITQYIHGWWGVILLGLAGLLCLQKPLPVKTLFLVLPAMTSIIVMISLLAISPYLNKFYNLAPVAKKIHAIQASGASVYSINTIHGNYNYLGRLRVPLIPNERTTPKQWAKKHPDGWLVYITTPHETIVKPEYEYPFRSRVVRLWQAKTYLRNPYAE